MDIVSLIISLISGAVGGTVPGVVLAKEAARILLSSDHREVRTEKSSASV
jgi:hypothetical protein